MPTYLLKTEPGEYSFDDLLRDRRTTWTGVSNPAALIVLRGMKKGDEAFIYHTGEEKSIVGLAQVVSHPYEDPKQPGRNDRGEPRFAVVDLAPVKKASAVVSLAGLKADERFAAFKLVTHSRQSVLDVPTELDTLLRAMAGLGNSRS